MRSPTGITGKDPWETTRLIGWMCKDSDVFSRPVLIGRGLDLFTKSPLCRFEGAPAPTTLLSEVSGGHGERETPLPIPNRAVKPLRADGTAWVTVWESRSLPGLFQKAHLARWAFSFFSTTPHQRIAVIAVPAAKSMRSSTGTYSSTVWGVIFPLGPKEKLGVSAQAGEGGRVVPGIQSADLTWAAESLPEAQRKRNEGMIPRYL